MQDFATIHSIIGTPEDPRCWDDDYQATCTVMPRAALTAFGIPPTKHFIWGDLPYPYAPWCWNIYQHLPEQNHPNVGKLPAPWSIWDMCFWHAHIFSVGQRPQSKETLCLIYGMYRLSKSQDMILKYMLRVKVQSSTFTHNLVDLTTFFPPIVVVLIYLHIYIICNESMRCCFHKSVFC